MIFGSVPETAQLLLGIFASDILPIFVDRRRRLTCSPATPACRSRRCRASRSTPWRRPWCSTSSPRPRFQGFEFGRMAAFYVLVAASAAVDGPAGRHPAASRPGFALRISAGRRLLQQRQLRPAGGPARLRPRGAHVRQRLLRRRAPSSATRAASCWPRAGAVRSGRRSPASLRVPAVYGAVAAAIVMASGLHVPDAIARPMTLLSDAALPMMVLVLGMQLERATWPERPVDGDRGVAAVARRHAAGGVRRRAPARAAGRGAAGRRRCRRRCRRRSSPPSSRSNSTSPRTSSRASCA